MVIFNDLRISEDKDCLIVDCEIEDVDGYDGMYIESVSLEWYGNVLDTGYPSEKSYQMYSDDGTKANTHVRLSVTIDDINIDGFGADTFDNGLFFVYVHCDGTPTNPDTLDGYGCGADKTWDTGIVLDWKMIYEWGMGYAAKLAKSCGNKCDEPTGFKQFIMFWYALQLAISTCDYSRVRDLWNRILRMYKTSNSASLSSGCGCK